MSQYRQAEKHRGVPMRLRPESLHGPRMQRKASQGWKGARFKPIFILVGIFCFCFGAALLVGVVLGWDPGRYLPIRPVLTGLWFAGTGLVVLVGHPVRVITIRRRYAALADAARHRAVASADSSSATFQPEDPPDG